MLARLEGGSTEFEALLEIDGESEFPLGFEIEARFRNVSKEEDAADPTRLGGVDAAGASRPPLNFSSALIRLEIPEETFTFLATKTGDIGSLLSG